MTGHFSPVPVGPWVIAVIFPSGQVVSALLKGGSFRPTPIHESSAFRCSYFTFICCFLHFLVSEEHMQKYKCQKLVGLISAQI